MTEQEGDLLYEIVEQFWLDFSALCNEAILKVPEHLAPEIEAMLQDKTSVYGRDITHVKETT